MKQKTLPAVLIFRLINADLDTAVCGSVTKCGLANALRRTIRNPEPSFVGVRENRITITWQQMLHHYELTRPALKIIARNDDGSLSLAPGVSHVVRLPRIRVRKAHVELTAARRKQIRDAGKAAAEARAAAGLPPLKYENARVRAARSAGVALKKLRRAAAQAAAVAGDGGGNYLSH